MTDTAKAAASDAEQKQAPGPWRIETPVDELLKFQVHCIGERPTMEILADGKHAAGGFYHPIALVADNDLANARLIAAAPDLLAALKMLVENCTAEYPAMPGHITTAEAAIARAEGR